jgi:hypothetical protein
VEPERRLTPDAAAPLSARAVRPEKTGDETEEVVAYGGYLLSPRVEAPDVDAGPSGVPSGAPSGVPPGALDKETYRAKGKDYAVSSGTSDGGKRIYYEKVIYRDDVFARIHLEYPASEREVVGRLVQRMEKTLKFAKCAY